MQPTINSVLSVIELVLQVGAPVLWSLCAMVVLSWSAPRLLVGLNTLHSSGMSVFLHS